MGIAIQELLSQEYFKDFYVLAGAKGLHREIQGITVMEAPDGTLLQRNQIVLKKRSGKEVSRNRRE